MGSAGVGPALQELGIPSAGLPTLRDGMATGGHCRLSPQCQHGEVLGRWQPQGVSAFWMGHSGRCFDKPGGWLAS